MKLKERRYPQIMEHIRQQILDSARIDVGVLIVVDDLLKPLKDRFENDELVYSVRHLSHKGYLVSYRSTLGDITEIGDQCKLTMKGLEEWLFPSGLVNPRKIFLSHATEDKHLAGLIKDGLKYDFDLFLAHEDIPGTVEWREKLIEELKTSAGFIALRTKRYKKKIFTEQECGFALAMGKRVLSLFVDTKPKDTGFCEAIQGAHFKESEVDQMITYCRKQYKIAV